MPADAGIRFGQYVLVRRIARGGMAEVFLAQQRGLEGFDRRVAVKRILPHLSDTADFVKMFFGEAKLAAQLSHPNIVHIYEFGKVDDDYFIAMEFVDGVHAGHLFKYAEKEKLPPTLVARIGADAANALHYAHELRSPTGQLVGLVHRDVSPANIMVSYDGVVKLCDFGIAKAAAATDHLTSPGQVKGKYAYMSPEQTIASQLDGRSDVFSLAIVLWELLVGRFIVPRGDAVAAMRAIRDGKLEPIDKAAPNVPAPLAAALSWALEPRREKRATAADFAQALEAFLKSAPELATSMQLGAWIRARFVREATGLMTALPATGGIAVGTQMTHGTVGSPSTAASPGTVGGGSSSSSYPARRIVRLLSDARDGSEIYTTSEAPPASDLDDESAETIKGPRRPVRSATGPPPFDVRDSDDAQTLGGERGRRRQLSSGSSILATRVDGPTRVDVGPTGDVGATHADAAPTLDAGPTYVDAGPMHRDVGSAGGPAARDGSEATIRGEAWAISESGARRVVRGLPEPGTHRDMRRDLPGGSGPRRDTRGGSESGTPRDIQNASDARGRGGMPSSRLASPPPDGLGGLPSASVGPSPASVVADPAAAADPALRSLLESGMRRRQTPQRLVRRRRRNMVLGIASLAALAILSFLIALAASGSKPRRRITAPHGVMPVAPDAAALPLAPPPLDAALAATVPIDASDEEPEKAHLIVRTIPDGGTIRVGETTREATVHPGDPTGATTAELELDAGTHDVTAELEGYAKETRKVVLRRGETQRIEITFRNKLPAAREPRVKTGRLTVRTTPWSDVYIGAKKIGQAPFTDLEVPTGTYKLTFRNPARSVVTKTVTITAGKTAKLSFSLP